MGDAASGGERPAQHQAGARRRRRCSRCSQSWRSRAAAGSGTSPRRSRRRGYVSYAFTLFLIVFVLAIPVAAYGFLIQAREGQVARKSFKSRILQNFATMLFFGFLAFIVIYMKRHHNQIFHIDTSALDKSKNALKNRPHRTGAAKYEPQFEWTRASGSRSRGSSSARRRCTCSTAVSKKRKSLTAGPRAEHDRGPDRRRCRTRSTTSRPSPTRAAP